MKAPGVRWSSISTIARDITGSQRAAEALQEANNRLRTLVEASPLAIIARDMGGGSSAGIRRRNGCSGGVRKRSWGRSLPTIPQGPGARIYRALDQRRLQGMTILGLELRRQRRDSSLIDVSVSTAPLHDGAGAKTGTMSIIEDITERKRMGERLWQVSRAFKAITECHQALIRATNETELLNEVCRIIVEVGGYRMAWVGFAQDDASKSVRPVAQTGFDDGYVEQLHVNLGGSSSGAGAHGKSHPNGETGDLPGYAD